MIDLYALTSPNVQKIFIMLEECGLPYNQIKVDVWAGEQFKPEFLKVNPNAKVPAIVDHDGPGGKPFTVFESGAILLYLAGKTGRFYPNDLRGRCDVAQWLFWQMGNLGPMAGQAHHFRLYAPEQLPYAIDRYTRECGRLYRVLDRRLADREFVAGEYSIADMASYPWIRPERQGQDLNDFPNLARWHAAIKSRPAVERAYAIVERVNKAPSITDEQSRKILFGQDKNTVR